MVPFLLVILITLLLSASFLILIHKLLRRFHRFGGHNDDFPSGIYHIH